MLSLNLFKSVTFCYQAKGIHIKTELTLFSLFLEKYVQTVHIHLAGKSIVLLVIQGLLVRGELMVH